MEGTVLGLISFMVIIGMAALAIYFHMKGGL